MRTTPPYDGGASAFARQRRQRAKNRRRAVITTAISCCALIAAAAFALGSNTPAEINDTPAWNDPSAQVGYYRGKSDEEIQTDLNAQVEKGMLNISINSLISQQPDGSADARIENIAANPTDIKVTLYTTDDENDILYQSGAIAPGEYIQTISLDRVLAPGTHPCTALFCAYDRQTHEKMGQAAAEVLIVSSKTE
jgi:hypothetical protein